VYSRTSTGVSCRVDQKVFLLSLLSLRRNNRRIFNQSVPWRSDLSICSQCKFIYESFENGNTYANTGEDFLLGILMIDDSVKRTFGRGCQRCVFTVDNHVDCMELDLSFHDGMSRCIRIFGINLVQT